MQFDKGAVGQTIRNLRKEKRLSQDVLSGLAGIARSHPTLLGWSVYGCRVAEYLGGQKFKTVYKFLFLAVVLIGSVSSVQLVWDVSDTFNGLMALPNLIGVLCLSPLVFRITKNYKERVFLHKSVKPMLSFYDKK